MPTVPDLQEGQKPLREDLPTYRLRHLMRAIEEDEARRDGLLLATVKQAKDVPPERAARILRQRARTGIDEDLIAEHLEEVESIPDETDWTEFRRRSPKMASWLARSRFHLPIVRQDLHALENLERLYRRIDDPLRPMSDAEVEAAARAAAKRKAPALLSLWKTNLATGLPLPIGARLTLEAAEEIAFQEELRRRQAEEAYIAGEGEAGVLERLKLRFLENPAFFVPFAGAAVDAQRAYRLWQAAKAKLSGTATEDQEDEILRFARLTYAADRRGETVFGKAVEILAGLPAIAGEFAATGGAYRTVKIGVEKTLQRALSKALSGAVRGVVRKTVGVAAGGAVQTLAMAAPRIAGGAFERMLPGISLSADQAGRLGAVLDPEAADDFGPALAKSLGVSFVETLSERAGVGAKHVLAPLKAILARHWLRRFPERGIEGFLSRVSDAAGWHGVLGEVFEERIAELGRAPIEGEYRPPTAEDLAAEILAFSVPSAAAAGARRLLGSRPASEEEALEYSPTIMSRVLEATAEAAKNMAAFKVAPEKAEEAIQEIVRATGGEFAYADARTFHSYFQGKKDEAGHPIDPKDVAEKLGVDPAVYDQALQSGARLRFQTARAANELVRGGHEEFFKNDLSFDPFVMSPRDTKEAMRLQAEEGTAPSSVEEATEEETAVQEDTARRIEEAAHRIRERVEAALSAAGFGRQARTHGALVEALYRTLGRTYGIDPEKAFGKYRLEIVRQEAPTETEGVVFEQPELPIGDLPYNPDLALPAVEIPGGLFDPSVEDLRGIAKQYYTERIQGTEIENSSMGPVRFSALGKGKVVSTGSSLIRLSAIKALPDLARIAVPIKRAADLRGRQGVTYVTAVAPLAVGDQIYTVRLIFRESKGSEGKPVFYEFFGYDVTEAGGGRADWPKPTQPEPPFAAAPLPASSAGTANAPERPAEVPAPPIGLPRTRTVSQLVEDIKRTPSWQKSFGRNARGRLRIGPNLEMAIDLFEAADESTFLHEFIGHFWLNVLGDLVESGQAPEALVKDYRTILDWLGVAGRAEITDELHEKWARAVEKYLMEGKAPSKELRGVFWRLMKWLSEIYRTIKESYFAGIDITPRLREVLDRMLATQEEIEEARAEERLEPLFADAKEAGATDAEAERYAELQEEIRAEAAARLLERTMAKIRRENEEWWELEYEKKTAEITKEVDAQPVYRLISALKTGTLPDGSPLPSMLLSAGQDTLKLSTRGVMSILEIEENRRGWLRNLLPTWAYAENGMHPDAVAEFFGYSSGRAMLEDLIAALPREQEIERRVKERMEEEFGEPETEEEIREKAIRALHNAGYAEALELEMRILARRNAQAQGVTGAIVATPRIPDRRVLLEEARRTIENMRLRDIDPRVWRGAERAAAKRAVTAWRRGDHEGALRAKADQLRNAALFEAATWAADLREVALVEFRRFFQSDEKLAKARDVDLVNAARAVLARMNIGRDDLNASRYLEALRKYDPDVYAAIEPLVLEASEGNREYLDLTVLEFLRAKEAVDALWNLALRNRQLEIEGKKIRLDEAATELRARLEEITGKKSEKSRYTHAVTTWEKAKIGFLGIRASLRRVESWVDAMDGGNPAGAFRKYLWTPISEAADRYRVAKRAYDRELASILAKIEKDFTAEKIEAPELGYTFGENGSGMAELLGAVSHRGNPSNFQKLLRGNGWGDFDDAGNLDTSRWDAFERRMWREGVLRKEHYDAIQAIWDLLEREKAAAWRAHKDMYGFYPDEITAQPFETPWGTYRGGYVPAKVDTWKTTDALRREEKEALERTDNSFAFPTTGRGATKRRVEKYAAPLVMDLRFLRGHLDWLARFVHLEPRVKDVARLIRHKDFREALEALDPTVANDMLVPWLQRAAQQIVETPMKGYGGRAIARFFRGIRRRTGLLLMAGNVVNGLQQLTGLSLAAVKVRPRYLRNALWRYIRDPKGTTDAVVEKSLFMANRAETETSEIVGRMEEMLLNPSAYERAKEFAERHAMIIARAFQGVVDRVTWLGAYEQAIEEGATEKDAVRRANSAVRLTQGSGAAEDVSRAETGNAFVRVFTQFYSYFNMQANLLGTEFVKVARDLGLRKGAGRGLYIYAMGFMIPAALAQAVITLMSGESDDDDDDGYMEEFLTVFFGGQRKAAVALLPGGRTLEALWGGFTKEWYDDRIQASPAVSVLESAVRSPASVYRAVVEEGRSSKAVRDAMTAIGLLSGLPTTVIGRPAAYLADVAEGETKPSGTLDVIRGLVTGR